MLAACTVAGSVITCRWALINALRANAKTVTIVTRALWAGVHVNPAQVTTTTQEINPDNNFDTSTANVKVGCLQRIYSKLRRASISLLLTPDWGSHCLLDGVCLHNECGCLIREGSYM